MGGGVGGRGDRARDAVGAESARGGHRREHDRPADGDTPRAAALAWPRGWWLVSWCIALWLGGWVAGHLAGMPRRQDATIHGVVTWAFTTLLLFYLLTTAIGSLIGGGFRTLGPLLSASGKGAAATVSGLDVPWDNIQRELATLLRQTGKAPAT